MGAKLVYNHGGAILCRAENSPWAAGGRLKTSRGLMGRPWLIKRRRSQLLVTLDVEDCRVIPLFAL